MKVFVCLKQVPDTNTQIKLRADQAGIDPACVSKWILNPYDEYAVEEAIKMKEAGTATQVFAVSVGPKVRTTEALRTALAMGADEAIVIDSGDLELDSFATAKALAGAIQKEGEFKFVLSGKLAIDDNNSAVSQMIAELLNIPHATVVSKLTVSDSALCEREIEGGSKEMIQLQVPALVAANKGLNSPRYASLPGIMKAKKKPVKELSLADVGVSAEDIKTSYKAFQLPAEKPPVQMIAGDANKQAQELVQLLRNQSKVI